MFADGGVLGKARLRGGDTASQHRLNVDLNPSTKVLHFLIGLGPVRLLRGLGQLAWLSHDTEQALRTAGIPALCEPVP